MAPGDKHGRPRSFTSSIPVKDTKEGSEGEATHCKDNCVCLMRILRLCSRILPSHTIVNAACNEPAHINLCCDSLALRSPEVQAHLITYPVPFVGCHGTLYPSLSCYVAGSTSDERIVVRRQEEGGFPECCYAIFAVARLFSKKYPRVNPARRERGYLYGTSPRVCCVHAHRTAPYLAVAEVLTELYAKVTGRPIDFVGGDVSDFAHVHSCALQLPSKQQGYIDLFNGMHHVFARSRVSFSTPS